MQKLFRWSLWATLILSMSAAIYPQVARGSGRGQGLDAVTVWDNGKAYFFKGGQYVRFDVRSDRSDPGYPQAIDGKTWPGLWPDGVDAAFNLGNGKAYFFKGNQYIRYDLKADRVDPGYPQAIDGRTWPGVWPGGVDAAVNWGNGKIYLFKGSQYIRYDVQTDRADPGYPQAIDGRTWPGIWTDGIDAAVNWGNGKAYFFKGNQYIRFDLRAERSDPGYPQTINEQNWPGIPRLLGSPPQAGTLVQTGRAYTGARSGTPQAVSPQSGRKLTISYKDGKKQEVLLDQPGCEISNVEYSRDCPPALRGDAMRKDYKDSKGTRVSLPCGRLAFADRVVSYQVGNPAPPDRRALDPRSALGEPDYISDPDDEKRPVFSAVTLGCGGSIVMEFTKVRLVDVEGPDLYVFEVGPAVEPTNLEISKDGVNWINIGRIEGGKASVDIRNFVAPGDQFRFVRLTDLKSACGGTFPGADIDAVAAIGCLQAP